MKIVKKTRVAVEEDTAELMPNGQKTKCTITLDARARTSQ